jgi:hypothetical protein
MNKDDASGTGATSTVMLSAMKKSKTARPVMETLTADPPHVMRMVIAHSNITTGQS